MFTGFSVLGSFTFDSRPVAKTVIDCDSVPAGVPRSTAMLITGHKTESIFERYNIKDASDAKAALPKVGQYSSGKVAAIK